jgi:hypothetical protein
MTNLIRSIAAALPFLLLTCVIYADQEAVVLKDIQISFKLDPRLTRGQYMGDIWISRPTYTGTSGQDTIEAKAEGLDAKGRVISITPEWIPSDPDMVTVSTRQGKDVKLTVRRDGESKLKVTSMGFSKELTIKAYYKDSIIYVAISVGQTSNSPSTAQTPSAEKSTR